MIFKYIEKYQKFKSEFNKQKRKVQTNKVTKQLATLLIKSSFFNFNVAKPTTSSTLNSETICC